MNHKNTSEKNQVNEIPQEAFDWYDEYAHGDIDRRTFLSRLATLTSALMPNYAFAEQVSFNDTELKASFVTPPSPEGHGENRGLNPYIKGVARRLAKSGYTTYAPDILHTLGGYPGNDNEGKAMQKSMDKTKVEKDFIAAANFLKNQPVSNGKLGVVGFCFGGYISNMLAATMPNDINAAVPFYGTPAKQDIVGNIKGPLMLQFAERDKRVNETLPAYEKLLKSKNVNFQANIYPTTNHGFHNDSTGRYDKAAAELAWKRTLEFFKQHIG